MRTIALLGLLVGCDLASSTTKDPGLGDTGPTGTTGTDGPPDLDASCPLDTIVASPGQESCFQCMQSACCAETQACDSSEDCVYCMANPLDTSARCVDQTTFEIRPDLDAMYQCQTDHCVPPCGVSSTSACDATDCDPTCWNYRWGCQI